MLRQRTQPYSTRSTQLLSPIAEANQRHGALQKRFQRYHDVDKALVRQIIAATPDNYLAALCDREYGYGAVTALQLLNHLKSTYGAITNADRDDNLLRLNAPWSPPTPIEDLFRQLADGQKMAADAGEPIVDSQLARIGYTLLLKTGVFGDACRDWRLKPDKDQQTFASFQVHFLRMDRDRLEQTTTRTAGYHAANAVLSNLPPEAINPPPPPSTHHVCAAASPSPSLASLTHQLRQCQAALAALTVSGPPAPAALPATTAVRSYCWTHGFIQNLAHTSSTCKHKAPGHVDTATGTNKNGGSDKIWTDRTRPGTSP